MNTAVAYAPNRYHRVQMNTASLNYAPSKGCACSSLKGYSLNCITFRTATDPACGSGGMFVQSAKFIQAHSGNRNNISVYGQEANADTWKMAKMNMAIRGIEADFGPHQADTFSNDLHKTLKADFILANPPFNYHPWGQERLTEDVRWKYGVPPANNANYAWICLLYTSPSPRD